MSGLTYDKKSLRKYSAEESIKEIIAKSILGAIVGSLFILAFAVGYKLGEKFHIPNIEEKISWNLQLVNAENAIDDSHNVELVKLSNGKLVDRRIYFDLQDMLQAARAEGLSPIVCSAYRSHEKQISLFNEEVRKYLNQGYSQEEAADLAARWVAIPGTSEHEIGLAVDIVSADNQSLDKSQENTAEQQWLMRNSYKYGFILRYPEEKSELTGISYEPWHYRYVGKEAAKQIVEKEVCLEEYLDDLGIYALVK